MASSTASISRAPKNGLSITGLWFPFTCSIVKPASRWCQSTSIAPRRLPGIARCYDVGLRIRDAIAAWPQDKPVAVIAAGGLSHSPGDSQMGHIDAAFDRNFLARLESGRRDGLVSLTNEETEATGSSTAEIRTWIILAGIFAEQCFRQVTYQPIDAWVTGCGQCIVGEGTP